MSDDDFLTPTEGSTAWVAELRRRCPTPEETDALRDKAERLAAIERQVLWRTEDMPADARYWRKFGVELAKPQCAYKDMFSRELCAAPDYRPDEPGPIWLPILDPPEGP